MAWCWEEYFLLYFAVKGYDVYALSLRVVDTETAKGVKVCGGGGI
jgi:hypothetical protein